MNSHPTTEVAGRTRVPTWLLIGVFVLLLHTGMLVRLVVSHSPTFDETGHLPAGISHLTTGRFDLYRVNPPLVRMLAAIPVLAFQPRTDWADYTGRPGERAEFKIGRLFMEINGPASFTYFFVARYVGVVFSLFGALICWRWAHTLWGSTGGIISLIAWCFDPTILGNAQTIQPDVPAATLSVASFYLLWRWYRNPTFSRAWVTGCVVGIALAIKTTLIMLLPAIPVLLFVCLWLRQLPSQLSLRSAIVQNLVMIGVALFVLNAVYQYQGSFTKLGDYHFVSKALRGNTRQTYAPDRPRDNRFAGTLLGQIPVPLPSDYVQGIDEQKVDFEGRLRSYLRGQTRHAGWWYYYLYALGIKTPLGTWVLLVLSLLAFLWLGCGGQGGFVLWFIVFPALLFMTLASSLTGMTQHMRYILPSVPFLFILCGNAGRLLDFLFDPKRNGEVRILNRLGWLQKVLAGVIVCATLAIVASCAAIFPHNHSYFNELVNGPSQGHRHLLSSNIDYGEDLFFARDWVGRHAPGQPLFLAYFGNFDPRVAGLAFAPPPATPQPGVYVISVNFLHPTAVQIDDGAGNLRKANSLAYLKSFQPRYAAGYGMQIYVLSQDDVANWNRMQRETP